MPLGMREFQPVCSPDLAPRLKQALDLGKVPVIEDTSTMVSWKVWFDKAGARMPELSGPRYSDPALAFEAATAGQGVLFAADRMSADAVKTGQLVRPFDLPVTGRNDYWFITSTARRVPKKVELFREWLLAEIAAE